MNKNEIRLLESTIETSSPKHELYFSEVDFDAKTICATDSRRLIKFNLREDELENCYGKVYVHKKILKAISQLMSKDIEYTFKNNCLVIHDTKIHLDTVNEDIEFEYPDTYMVLISARFEEQYERNNLMYIDFDTTHKNTHINSDSFKPVQEFAHYDRYVIQTKPQKEKEVGMVKIDGCKNVEDGITHKRLEMLMMGIEYQPPQQTLFD